MNHTNTPQHLMSTPVPPPSTSIAPPPVPFTTSTPTPPTAIITIIPATHAEEKKCTFLITAEEEAQLNKMIQERDEYNERRYNESAWQGWDSNTDGSYHSIDI
jgi:hypothetical protein